MRKEKLTQERLKELLRYDPETGDFVWRVRMGSRALKGDTAGHLHHTGYIHIAVLEAIYTAHRLAWLYTKGYFPKNIDIDHEDQIKHHNWWSNLRLASRQCNMRNCGCRKDNTSGVKGVIWSKEFQKWHARISVSGKKKHLGRYEDFDDAVRARLAGEQSLGWEGCDSSSPAYQYVQKILKEA